MRTFLSLDKFPSLYGLCLSIFLTTACPFALAGPPTNPGPTASRSTLSAEQLTQHLDKNLLKVEEFRFIKQQAEALGVHAYLFGGTAAGFLHYVRWDLQSLSGDALYNRDRFGYYFDQIFKATQDADVVVDGSAQQIQSLQKKIEERFPHLVGLRSAWEIRSLRESIGDPTSANYKEALLNDYSFLNQNSDSNSTTLIEITDPATENGTPAPRIRDLRNWNSTKTIFVEDALKEQISFYRSPNHALTPRAKNGSNPEIFSVIRYLTKAFQYELKIPEEDRQTILQIIHEFDPRVTPQANAKKRFLDLSFKLYRQSPNLERSQRVLQELGLLEKLLAAGKAAGSKEFTTLFGKEPLKTKEVGLGHGKTAQDLKIDIIAHETRSQEIFENITQSFKNEANVFISRPDHTADSETAAYGAGFYTQRGSRGAVQNGLNITFRLAPQAREGSDFEIVGAAKYVLVLNKAAIRVVEQKLEGSGADLLKALISSPEMRNEVETNKGHLTRHLRRLQRTMTQAEATNINRELIHELQSIKMDVQTARMLRKIYLEMIEDYGSANILNKFEQDYHLQVSDSEYLKFYVLPQLAVIGKDRVEKTKLAGEIIQRSNNLEELMAKVFAKGESTAPWHSANTAGNTPNAKIYSNLREAFSDIDTVALGKMLLEYVQASEDFARASKIKAALINNFGSSQFEQMLNTNSEFRDRINFIEASAAIINNLNATNTKDFIKVFEKTNDTQKLSLVWSFLMSRPSKLDDNLAALASSSESPLERDLEPLWNWMKSHRTEFYFYCKNQKYEPQGDMGPTSDHKKRLARFVEIFCQGTDDFKILSKEKPYIDSLGVHLTLSAKLKLSYDKFYALSLEQQTQAIAAQLPPGWDTIRFLESLTQYKTNSNFEKNKDSQWCDPNLSSLFNDIYFNQVVQKIDLLHFADVTFKKSQLYQTKTFNYTSRVSAPIEDTYFILLLAEMKTLNPNSPLNLLMPFVREHLSDLITLKVNKMNSLKEAVLTGVGLQYMTGFLTGLQLLHENQSRQGKSFSETLKTYLTFTDLSFKRGFFKFAEKEGNDRYFFDHNHIRYDTYKTKAFAGSAYQLLKNRESTAAIFDLMNNNQDEEESQKDSSRKVFKNSAEFLAALESAEKFSRYESPVAEGMLSKLFLGRYKFHEFTKDTFALSLTLLILHEGMRFGLSHLGAGHLPLASQIAMFSDWMQYTFAVITGATFILRSVTNLKVVQKQLFLVYKKLMALPQSPESQLERLSSLGYNYLINARPRPMCSQVLKAQ